MKRGPGERLLLTRRVGSGQELIMETFELILRWEFFEHFRWKAGCGGSKAQRQQGEGIVGNMVGMVSWSISVGLLQNLNLILRHWEPLNIYLFLKQDLDTAFYQSISTLKMCSLLLWYNVWLVYSLIHFNQYLFHTFSVVGTSFWRYNSE